MYMVKKMEEEGGELVSAVSVASLKLGISANNVVNFVVIYVIQQMLMN